MFELCHKSNVLIVSLNNRCHIEKDTVKTKCELINLLVCG